jgi:hypothetical protein
VVGGIWGTVRQAGDVLPAFFRDAVAAHAGTAPAAAKAAEHAWRWLARRETKKGLAEEKRVDLAPEWGRVNSHVGAKSHLPPVRGAREHQPGRSAGRTL